MREQRHWNTLSEAEEEHKRENHIKYLVMRRTALHVYRTYAVRGSRGRWKSREIGEDVDGRKIVGGERGEYGV